MEADLVNTLKVTVLIEGKTSEKVVFAKKGENLRKLLLKNNLSPYTKLTKQFNCGGNGICATCGVFVLNTNLEPSHWHDKLAKAFHYPRLSCQLTVEEDLIIEIPKKVIWGNRRKSKTT